MTSIYRISMSVKSPTVVSATQLERSHHAPSHQTPQMTRLLQATFLAWQSAYSPGRSSRPAPGLTDLVGEKLEEVVCDQWPTPGDLEGHFLLLCSHEVVYELCMTAWSLPGLPITHSCHSPNILYPVTWHITQALWDKAGLARP